MGTKGSAKIGGFAMNEISYYYAGKSINKSKYITNPKMFTDLGILNFINILYIQ